MSRQASEAFEAGLAALRRREQTTTELLAWLQQHGYDAEQVDAAVSRLTEGGELDDARFARRYAEDKRELRGWGAGRIREALTTRGVPPELVEAALQSDDHSAELDRATEILVRRNRSLAEDADRARALGYLTRRGYDYEVAYEAVRLAARGSA